MGYQIEHYSTVLVEADSFGLQLILTIIWMEVDHLIYQNKLTIRIDTSNGILFIMVIQR